MGKNMPVSVWSYGGGVQSAAIACMVASGELPTPDFAVIADTGREASTTWDYMHQHVQPLLDRTVGLKIDVAPHSLSTVDLYSKSGSLLIPAYTNHSGKPGQLPTFCSNEWKRRVVMRWMRKRGIEAAELWLGISVDEASRMKDSDVNWMSHRYPLIEKFMKRQHCYDIVERAGLPRPPKSSCWMCPFRGSAEWAALPLSDIEKATAFDLEIRERDPSVFLLKSMKPFSLLNATMRSDTSGACDQGGFCWT